MRRRLEEEALDSAIELVVDASDRSEGAMQRAEHIVAMAVNLGRLKDLAAANNAQRWNDNRAIVGAYQ